MIDLRHAPAAVSRFSSCFDIHSCPRHASHSELLLLGKTYSEEQGNSSFKVIFGQCFGSDWVHLDNFPLGTTLRMNSEASIARGPDRVQSMGT